MGPADPLSGFDEMTGHAVLWLALSIYDADYYDSGGFNPRHPTKGQNTPQWKWTSCTGLSPNWDQKQTGADGRNNRRAINHGKKLPYEATLDAVCAYKSVVEVRGGTESRRLASGGLEGLEPQKRGFDTPRGEDLGIIRQRWRAGKPLWSSWYICGSILGGWSVRMFRKSKENRKHPAKTKKEKWLPSPLCRKMILIWGSWWHH